MNDNRKTTSAQHKRAAIHVASDPKLLGRKVSQNENDWPMVNIGNRAVRLPTIYWHVPQVII